MGSCPGRKALANSRAVWGWGWVEVLPLSPAGGGTEGKVLLSRKPWLEMDPELSEVPSPVVARPGQVRKECRVWRELVAFRLIPYLKSGESLLLGEGRKVRAGPPSLAGSP